MVQKWLGRNKARKTKRHVNRSAVLVSEQLRISVKNAICDRFLKGPGCVRHDQLYCPHNVPKEPLMCKMEQFIRFLPPRSPFIL